MAKRLGLRGSAWFVPVLDGHIFFESHRYRDQVGLTLATISAKPTGLDAAVALISAPLTP